MFNRLFKPATAITKTARTLTTYQKYNTFRHDAAPGLLFGGLFGGAIVGGSLGWSMGLINSTSDYMKGKAENISSIPAETAASTIAGTVAGTFVGVGLSLAVLAPEAALIGAAVALACQDEKVEEKQCPTFRR